MSTVDGHANGNTGNGGMTRSMTEMTLPFQSIMSTVSTPGKHNLYSVIHFHNP